MRWVSRLVTVAVFVVLVGGVALWLARAVDEQEVGGSFVTSAAFRDASRLPVGSRVMTSGVHVGEITGLSVDGRIARVHMRLRDDLVLYSNAWAEKKAESLFGDGYVELHPGSPAPGVRRLESGEPIPRVVDEVSTDRTLRELDQALPRASEALRDAERVLALARRQVSGPMREWLEEVERTTADPDLLSELRTADESLARFEAATGDARDALDGQPPRVLRAMDDFAADVAGVTTDLRDGRADLARGLGDARARIDEVDPYLADAIEVLANLDGQAPPEDQGTLGRLINDPTLGDELAVTTEDISEATDALAGLQTFIGLRAEFNVLAAQPRFYVIAEIAGRHDSFYLLELEKGGLGVAESTLVDVPGDDTFLRSATIRERLRFTAQWGRRLRGGSRVRFGIKESSFGFGADVVVARGQLTLSTDLFGASFSRVPRLKLGAALRVAEVLYLVGGVDDVLQRPGTLPIAPWPAEQDAPIQFEEVRYGRDVFFGAMLRFEDEDIEELLFLYGAVVLGLL